MSSNVLFGAFLELRESFSDVWSPLATSVVGVF